MPDSPTISTTHISLVRHGEIDNPAGIVYGRLPRFALSRDGRRQVLAAAEYLSGARMAAMFTGPLLRARQTAQILLASHTGVALHVSQWLNEVYTPYEGCTRSSIGPEWDLYSGNKPPFEQPVDVVRRIERFVAKVRRRFPGQHVVAVTHGDVIAFGVYLMKGGTMPITPTYQQLLAQVGMEGGYPAHASITTLCFKTSTDDNLLHLSYTVPYR